MSIPKHPRSLVKIGLIAAAVFIVAVGVSVDAASTDSSFTDGTLGGLHNTDQSSDATVTDNLSPAPVITTQPARVST